MMKRRHMIFAIVLVLLAVFLLWASARLRARTGLPHGRVIYSDTGAWQRNEQALFSKTHQLSGKPDYLVRQNTQIIPVEVKSAKAPAQPREGHILQLAAYCLLVEENYEVRPSHGIIQYADKQFAVDYTPKLERELLIVMDQMRQDYANGDAQRSHNEVWRCTGCGLKENCELRIKN